MSRRFPINNPAGICLADPSNRARTCAAVHAGCIDHTTAAASTPPEIVTLLLEKGADALAKNKDGYQAIDYAKENENLKDTAVYQQLLELSKE
jgi:hypothetical protein